MGSAENIRTIEGFYAAFGKGDVQTILDGLVDDVDWGTDAASEVAPWHGVRHGKQEVGRFFEQFGSTMEVEEFTPKSIGANETDVFALVRMRAKSRATGKAMDMNLHHYFSFRDGRVALFRGTEDMPQVWGALQK